MNKQEILSNLSNLFDATDVVLSEWQGEGNLRFPTLLKLLEGKLNLTEEQSKGCDALVRHYVRNHDDWYVTRGAGGGIMRKSDKMKKDAELRAKAEVKAKLRQQVEETAVSNQVVDQVEESPVSNQALDQVEVSSDLVDELDSVSEESNFDSVAV